MRTLEYYFGEKPKSRQHILWDDYITMMYCNQDHPISMHQNEATPKFISKWWRF